MVALPLVVALPLMVVPLRAVVLPLMTVVLLKLVELPMLLLVPSAISAAADGPSNCRGCGGTSELTEGGRSSHGRRAGMAYRAGHGLGGALISAQQHHARVFLEQGAARQARRAADRCDRGQQQQREEEGDARHRGVDRRLSVVRQR